MRDIGSSEWNPVETHEAGWEEFETTCCVLRDEPRPVLEKLTRKGTERSSSHHHEGYGCNLIANANVFMCQQPIVQLDVPFQPNTAYPATQRHTTAATCEGDLSKVLECCFRDERTEV